MTNMIRCTIEFTGGTLKGLTYDNQRLPASIAKVGHKVKRSYCTPSAYTVVQVHG